MKLSDTQLVILTAASQRDDRLALPLPKQLKGGAAAKVVGSLIAKGLLEEVEATRGSPIWRQIDDAHGMTLVITDAALAALGIESDSTSAAARPAAAKNEGGKGAPSGKRRNAAKNEANEKTPKQQEPRKGTKQAQLIAMLRRAKGATVDEIVEALEWQAHTVRGAMAGALKKKLGLTIESGGRSGEVGFTAYAELSISGNMRSGSLCGVGSGAGCAAAASFRRALHNYPAVVSRSIASSLSGGRKRPGFRLGICEPASMASFSVGSARR